MRYPAYCAMQVNSIHPESDGQTERVNRILEDVLRHFVGPQQDDWVKYLKTAQFAINNSWQESVRHTPFFLNHGRHPNMPGLEGLMTKVLVSLRNTICKGYEGCIGKG
jgi:hypothetical protein